jgi:hypothetical protein
MRRRHTLGMEIEQWWPKLSESTQVWLQQNNGSALPENVAAEIVAAGGPAADELADADVDWIEAVANGETPV